MLQSRPKALECGDFSPLLCDAPGPGHKAAKHRRVLQCGASALPCFDSTGGAMYRCGDASPHSKTFGAQHEAAFS